MRGRYSKRTLWPTVRTSDYKGSGPEGSKSHEHMSNRNYLCAVVLDSIPTSETSTELPTGEQLYLPVGFLASHFPKPGSEEARKMTVTSGQRCTALLESASPLGSFGKCCWNRHDGTRQRAF